MIKLRSMAMVLFAAVTFCRAGDAHIDDNQVIPGAYLIRRAEGVSTDQLLHELRQELSPDVTVVGEIERRRLAKILVPGVEAQGKKALSIVGHPVDNYMNSMVDTAVRIAALKSVESIEPATILRLTSAPANATALSSECMDASMRRIGIKQLPKIKASVPDKPIVVAVIESGIFLQHEIFQGLILDGADVSGGSNSARAQLLPDGRMESHGTGTAGLIAALIRGGKINGRPRANIKILPIRATLEDDASLETFDAIKAIDYAIARGAGIIMAGWGKSGESAALLQAVMDADTADIAIVTSAGNGLYDQPGKPSSPTTGYDIDDNKFYPASWHLKNLIAVAALGSNDTLARFSNWGRRSVQLSAPGDHITVPPPLLADSGAVVGGYQARSGTSLSAALVAGAIALYAAANPHKDYASLVARVGRAVAPQAALADVVSSGGELSLDRVFKTGFTAPPPQDTSPYTTKPENGMTRGRLGRLIKMALSGGPIPSEAPVLKGCDVMPP